MSVIGIQVYRLLITGVFQKFVKTTIRLPYTVLPVPRSSRWKGPGKSIVQITGPSLHPTPNKGNNDLGKGGCSRTVAFALGDTNIVILLLVVRDANL